MSTNEKVTFPLRIWASLLYVRYASLAIVVLSYFLIELLRTSGISKSEDLDPSKQVVLYSGWFLVVLICLGTFIWGAFLKRTMNQKKLQLELISWAKEKYNLALSATNLSQYITPRLVKMNPDKWISRISLVSINNKPVKTRLIFAEGSLFILDENRKTPFRAATPSAELAENELNKFYDEAREEGVFWLTNHDGQMLLAKDSDGDPVVFVWSDPLYAELDRDNIMPNDLIAQTSLSHWTHELLPAYIQEGFYVMLNPNKHSPSFRPNKVREYFLWDKKLGAESE